MIFPLSFRQEYTIETSVLTAQLTRYLSSKSGPISRLPKEEIQSIAASDVSRPKPILMNMATKIRRKAHECKHCGQLFDQLSAYKRHGRTHTGMKVYTCKHCKKCFSQSSYCKEHERMHTGEKPYACKYCKKTFTWSSSCKQHERTHTGEKPYTCKHCKKTFS